MKRLRRGSSPRIRQARQADEAAGWTDSAQQMVDPGQYVSEVVVSNSQVFGRVGVVPERRIVPSRARDRNNVAIVKVSGREISGGKGRCGYGS